MCDYIGHEFGASYPDSVCIDGFLWDADSCHEPGGPLYNGGEIPCPECNHPAWQEYFRENIEMEGYEATEAGETVCPFDTDKPLKYEEDRTLFRQWWMKGYADFRGDAQ